MSFHPQFHTQVSKGSEDTQDTMVGGSMERVRLSDIVVEKTEKKPKRKFFFEKHRMESSILKKKQKKKFFSEKETEKKVFFCMIHLSVLDVCDNDQLSVKWITQINSYKNELLREST